MWLLLLPSLLSHYPPDVNSWHKNLHPNFPSFTHPHKTYQGALKRTTTTTGSPRKKEGSGRVYLMASAIPAIGSSFYGSWGTSIAGEDYSALAKTVPSQVRFGRGKAVRSQPVMKNVNEGKGLFAPIVVVTRNIIGKKRFNQLRGKAIALHSQVCFNFSLQGFNCCLFAWFSRILLWLLWL